MTRMIRYAVAVYIGLLIAGAVGPIPTAAEAESSPTPRPTEPAGREPAADHAVLPR